MNFTNTIKHNINSLPYCILIFKIGVNQQSHTWSGTFADASISNVLGTHAEDDYYPCYHAWSSLAIRYNGQVVPCCRDLQGEYIVGNVKETPLIDIWNGSKLKNLREHMKTRDLSKISLCLNCTKLWEGNHPCRLIRRHWAVICKRLITQMGGHMKKRNKK